MGAARNAYRSLVHIFEWKKIVGDLSLNWRIMLKFMLMEQV
jgi:hypothetical protein